MLLQLIGSFALCSQLLVSFLAGLAGGTQDFALVVLLFEFAFVIHLFQLKFVAQLLDLIFESLLLELELFYHLLISLNFFSQFVIQVLGFHLHLHEVLPQFDETLLIISLHLINGFHGLVHSCVLFFLHIVQLGLKCFKAIFFFTEPLFQLGDADFTLLDLLLSSQLVFLYLVVIFLLLAQEFAKLRISGILGEFELGNFILQATTLI